MSVPVALVGPLKVTPGSLQPLKSSGQGSPPDGALCHCGWALGRGGVLGRPPGGQ